MKPLTKPLSRDDGQFWCGPWAAAAATGCFMEDIEEGIKEYRQQRTGKPAPNKITFSSGYELWHAVKRFGYECREAWTIQMHLQNIGMSASGMFNRRNPKHVLPTFTQWLRGRTPEEMKRTYLVLVTNHWIAVRGRKVVDTGTRSPVFMGQMRNNKRKRLQYILEVYVP